MAKKSSFKSKKGTISKKTNSLQKKDLKNSGSSKAKIKKPAAIDRKKRIDSGLPEKLKNVALKVLEGRKAEQIFTADVRGQSAMVDYIIVASGRSARQLTAIASYLYEAFAKTGANKIRTEGLPQGNWVLVDAGDVLVHLFRPEVRSYYGIDSLLGQSSEKVLKGKVIKKTHKKNTR